MTLTKVGNIQFPENENCNWNGWPTKPNPFSSKREREKSPVSIPSKHCLVKTVSCLYHICGQITFKHHPHQTDRGQFEGMDEGEM